MYHLPRQGPLVPSATGYQSYWASYQSYWAYIEVIGPDDNAPVW